MDINCTNKCVYQTEGKCTLDQLSGGTAYSVNDTDCPYCSTPGVTIT